MGCWICDWPYLHAVCGIVTLTCPPAIGGGRFFAKDLGRLVVQLAVWPDLVIALPLAFDFVSGMVDIAPPMLIQALVADLAVEAFDVSILIWFTWLDKLMVNFSFVGPGTECGSRELRPVVGQ